jgi:prefoldin subunit 5
MGLAPHHDFIISKQSMHMPDMTGMAIRGLQSEVSELQRNVIKLEDKVAVLEREIKTIKSKKKAPTKKKVIK